MKYFRNTDLVRLYHISDKAVRNWIRGAKQGRYKLELFEKNGKIYIADTLPNEALIEILVEKGKKYRNSRNHKVFTPSQDFYSLYTSTQIVNIINNLHKYHEFPQQYRYVGEGAYYWDAYLHKLYAGGKDNQLTSTIQLLQLDRDYLAHLLKQYAYVNVIDVGVGNGLAVKELVQFLLEKSALKHYIGVDVSQELLDITTQNFDEWFGDYVKVESFVRDINHEQFGDILSRLSADAEAERTLNIILFLGGTLVNLRKPSQGLDTIRDSMGKDDILIFSTKLDSANSRRFFDFNTQDDKTLLSYRNKFVLDLLSVDVSSYEVEQFFDIPSKSRRIQVRFKTDITLNFDTVAHQKKIEMRKGDTILLFRSWEYSDSEILKLFEKNEFIQLRTTVSYNQEYMIMISRVKGN